MTISLKQITVVCFDSDNFTVTRYTLAILAVLCQLCAVATYCIIVILTLFPEGT